MTYPLLIYMYGSQINFFSAGSLLRHYPYVQTEATLCPVWANTAAAEKEIWGGHEGEDAVQAGEGPCGGTGGGAPKYPQEYGVI